MRLNDNFRFCNPFLSLCLNNTGRVDEKATQLHAIASLKALLDAAKTEADSTVTNNSRSKPVSPPQVPASVQPSDAPLTTVDIEDQQANGDAPTAQVVVF